MKIYARIGFQGIVRALAKMKLKDGAKLLHKFSYLAVGWYNGKPSLDRNNKNDNHYQVLTQMLFN